MFMIEWKEDYAVHIDSIDNQHQMFFDLINRLETLTEHQNYLDELPMLLNEIVEYTTYHFKTEERLMEESDYPDLESHKVLHNQIKKDIYIKCKQVIEKEPTTMDVIWLYNYMKDWIDGHILKDDAKYSHHICKYLSEK